MPADIAGAGAAVLIPSTCGSQTEVRPVTAFAKTRTAARYAVAHSVGLAAYRAAVLARQARACERAVSDGDRELPAVSSGLMRDLVQAVRDLVGGAWLAASGDDPDIAAFNALEAVAVPPAPSQLDEILSRVLWARFAPQADRDGTPQGGEGAGRQGAGSAAASME